MRIQFCFNGDFDGHPNTVAEFDVAEVPTDEECKAIEDEIYNAMDKWEETGECFTEFDYWQVCHDAVIQYVHIVQNPVVKTFYI